MQRPPASTSPPTYPPRLSPLTHGSGPVDPAQPGAQSRAGLERRLLILEEVAAVAGAPAEPAAKCRAGRTENSTVKTRKEDKAESPLGEMRAAQGGQRSEQEVRRGGREAGYRGGERKNLLLLLLGKSGPCHHEPAGSKTQLCHGPTEAAWSEKARYFSWAEASSAWKCVRNSPDREPG